MTPGHGGIELGARFTPDADGQVTGVRFYKGLREHGHAHRLPVDAGGTLLATADFPGSRHAAGRRLFATPVAVTAGTTYVVSYQAPNGSYSATLGQFAPAVSAATAAHAAGAGRYLYGSGFPGNTRAATTGSTGLRYEVHRRPTRRRPS